jgi:hypothetical protein
MKADKSDYRCGSWRRRACVAIEGVALICASFSARAFFAQSATNTMSSQNDPLALAVVTNALTAMGGAANWQAIGAATAEVMVSRPGKQPRTIQWADDWHLGYDLSRRDTQAGSGQTITMISLKDHRLYVAGGSPHTLPHENDIAELAVAYPAAALVLSLQRTGCIFRSLSAYVLDRPPAGTETIGEDCRDPFFSRTVHLIWTFSTSTGLPSQVRLPVRLLLHSGGVAYETARFAHFASQGNLQAPTDVSLILPSGQTIELQIGPRTFTSSLPNSTFTIPQ